MSAPGHATAIGDLPVTARPDAAGWRRVAARLIDGATVAMIVGVLGVAQIVRAVEWGIDRVHDVSSTMVVVSLAIAVGASTEALFVTRSRGQTPGHDILHVRVIGRRADRVGVARALGRWAPPVLAALLPFVVRPVWLGAVPLATVVVATLVDGRWAVTDLVGRTRAVPYDRDREDPHARRPSSRRQRRADRHRPTLEPPQGAPRDLVER